MRHICPLMSDRDDFRGAARALPGRVTEVPQVVVGSAAELGISPEVIRAFYRTHWASPTALTRADFYEHQFLDHPGAPDRDDTRVAIVDDQIVGVMGLTERPFLLDGARQRAAEGTTWVVDPEARGLGVGKAMLASIQREFDLFVGASITDEALRLYLPAGFQFLRLLPRCVRVLGDDLPHDVAHADRLGVRLADLRAAPSLTPFSATAITTASALDASLFSGPGTKGSMNGFVRDVPYFQWRYTAHPTFVYELHFVTGRGDGAVVVTRSDEVDGVHFCHVVDVLGDARDLPAVVGFLDEYAIEHELAIVDFVGTNPVVVGQLRAGGWFSMVDELCLQVTHLFYPVEFRTPPTTSLMLWSRADMAGLLDVGRLHVTKGDLDLDRPTLSYYERKLGTES